MCTEYHISCPTHALLMCVEYHISCPTHVPLMCTQYHIISHSCVHSITLISYSHPTQAFIAKHGRSWFSDPQVWWVLCIVSMRWVPVLCIASVWCMFMFMSMCMSIMYYVYGVLKCNDLTVNRNPSPLAFTARSHPIHHPHPNLY